MDEIKISIHKARSIIRAEPARSAFIEIAEEFPVIAGLGVQDAYQFAEAEKLEMVLYGALPGGTYDRLFGIMCQRKASHFRVRHEEPVKNDLLEAAKAALKLMYSIDDDHTAGSELYAQIEQAIAKSEQP